MFVWAVLALTLLGSATVEAGGGVSVWMDNTRLTCPWNGKWYKGKGSSYRIQETPEKKTYEYKYTGGTDQFYCEYNEQKYHFYIQGKPCGNCVELDAWLFAVVLVADVTGTVVLMALIYRCSRRSAGSAGSAGGAPKPQKAGRSRNGDTHELQTYQELNPNTRSYDPYSAINRMG